MRPPEPGADGLVMVNGRQEIERVVFIPTAKIGYLIGYAGRTIQSFERVTGAKIDILTPKSRCTETSVLLSGPPPTVSRVMRMIDDLYGSYNFSSQLWEDNRRDPETGIRRDGPGLATEEIKVKAELVELLIENGAPDLRTIEQQAGVKIKILHSVDASHITPLNVTGNAEQNAVAIEMLQSKICELEKSIKAKAKEEENEKQIWKKTSPRPKIWSPSPQNNFTPQHGLKEDDWIDFQYAAAASPAAAAARFSNNNNNDPHFVFDSRMMVLVKVPVSKAEVETLDLSQICKENDVSMEIVKENGSEGVFCCIHIRGCEAAAMNAKGDVIRSLAKRELRSGLAIDDEDSLDSMGFPKGYLTPISPEFEDDQ